MVVRTFVRQGEVMRRNKQLLNHAWLLLAFTGTPADAKSGNAPIPKFERSPPEDAFLSSSQIFDIERCLIRLDIAVFESVPIVFSQPDRPDERMLIWPGAGSGAFARIDLRKRDTGTEVRSWRVRQDNPTGFDACAPKAAPIR